MKFRLALLLVPFVILACDSAPAPKPEKKRDEVAQATEWPKAEKSEPETLAGPFIFAWSEYPSWSAFDVGRVRGYLDPREGYIGLVEKKWKVDIVLTETDYDSCIGLYSEGKADAVAITNMDILGPSLDRASVAILPTSTSFGADAVLVTSKVQSVADLKKIPTHGLGLSVSQYMFARNLEMKGLAPAEYAFTSMDPGDAAAAMEAKKPGFDSIAVWNPFVLTTLEKRAGEVRVLFDSTSIPGEIIDMVVAAEESLKKPGGDAFAHALVETFYLINRELNDPAKRDATLIAIGEKFAGAGLTMMNKVVEQTRFYGTSQAGISLFDGGPVLSGVSQKTLKEIMPLVAGFSRAYGIIDRDVSIIYGEGQGNLRFDSRYMKRFARGGGSSEPAR